MAGQGRRHRRPGPAHRRDLDRQGGRRDPEPGGGDGPGDPRRGRRGGAGRRGAGGDRDRRRGGRAPRRAHPLRRGDGRRTKRRERRGRRRGRRPRGSGAARRAAAAAAPATTRPPAATAAPPRPRAQPASASSPRRSRAGSPRREGVDLARVRGSGAQGRITKDDVLRAIERAPPTLADGRGSARRAPSPPPLDPARAGCAGAAPPRRAPPRPLRRRLPRPPLGRGRARRARADVAHPQAHRAPHVLLAGDLGARHHASSTST